MAAELGKGKWQNGWGKLKKMGKSARKAREEARRMRENPTKQTKTTNTNKPQHERSISFSNVNKGRNHKTFGNSGFHSFFFSFSSSSWNDNNIIYNNNNQNFQGGTFTKMRQKRSYKTIGLHAYRSNAYTDSGCHWRCLGVVLARHVVHSGRQFVSRKSHLLGNGKSWFGFLWPGIYTRGHCEKS